MARNGARRTKADRRLDDMHADMCVVFSNSIRVGILMLLSSEALSAGSLSFRLGVSAPTLSKHLKVMRERGVLEPSRNGTVIVYRVRDPRVLKAFFLMREALVESIGEKSRIVTAASKRGQ